MTDRSQFNIGQVVHHRKFDYRGVIIDVDAEFEGDDEWYEQVALSRPPKDAPWYHILVDNADHMTYVAERHLEADDSLMPVSHPYINNIFGSFADGVYQRRGRIN
jgi:heat shock protein HspQ